MAKIREVPSSARSRTASKHRTFWFRHILGAVVLGGLGGTVVHSGITLESGGGVAFGSVVCAVAAIWLVNAVIKLLNP